MAVKINGTDGVTTPNLTATNNVTTADFINTGNYNGGYLSNRNMIINGAMKVAQRGTSTTGVTGTGYYACDRIRLAPSSSTASTVTQESDAPAGFTKSYKFSVTTANAVTSGDYARIDYFPEGQDLQHLNYGTSSAQNTMLSFWVKSNVTGQYVFWMYQYDASPVRHISRSYTIDTADTWQKITLSIPGDTAGNINDDPTAGVIMAWMLAAGSTWTSGTAPSSGWANASNADRYADHQVDVFDTVGNYFQITGLQWEVGENATPFEHRSYGQELLACQRYYEVHTCDTNRYAAIWSAALNTSSNCWASWQFKTEKRASPTFGLVNGGAWSKLGSTENVTPMTTGVNFNSNGYFYFYTSTGNIGDPILSADAEL